MTNPLAHVADRIADVVVEEGARVRAELAAGLSKTVDAARVAGALAVPVGTGGRLRTARGRLVGWSLKENAGTPAPAVVTVYGGQDATDATKLLAVIPLTAGAGASQLPAMPGVFFAEGVTVVVTGVVTGALYFAGTD